MTTLNPKLLTLALALMLLPSGPSFAQLVLSINRGTGGVTIRNDDDTAAVNIDGYSVTSINGLLDATGWSSFQDSLLADWEEAPGSSSNGFAEFNAQPGGFVTFNALQSVGLGGAYTTDVSAAITSVGFGAAYEDVVFLYSDDTANNLIQGTVEYTGPERFNNLVLEIDVVTGQASIINESTVSVAVDFYQVTSGDSVLNVGFDGLTQGGNPVPGWETGGTNTGQALAQFFPQPAGGFTVPGGEVYDLGVTFDAGNASRDVDFLFHIADGADAGFAGEVRFIENAGLLGDFNGDGAVDAIDYAVWRESLNAADDSLINNAGVNDGVVDAADLAVWQDNFGAGGAGSAAGVATPEPLAGSLLLLGVGVLLPVRRKCCPLAAQAFPEWN